MKPRHKTRSHKLQLHTLRQKRSSFIYFFPTVPTRLASPRARATEQWLNSLESGSLAAAADWIVRGEDAHKAEQGHDAPETLHTNSSSQLCVSLLIKGRDTRRFQVSQQPTSDLTNAARPANSAWRKTARRPNHRTDSPVAHN